MATSRPPAGDRPSGRPADEAVPEFDAAAREQVAATLAAQRVQALSDLSELTGHDDDLVSSAQLSNADDEHDPEGATLASERSQLDALVRAAQDRLAEIGVAEARLAEGRYGLCETCGRPIAPARLEARPVARTCIDCAGR
jgi:RNA polymerase-binding transcription factor DksA